MVLFLVIFYIAVQFQAVMVVNKLLCNEIDYVRYVCVCVRERDILLSTSEVKYGL